MERRCPFSPPAAYERLRDEGVVGRFEAGPGRTGWVLTSYDDVTEALTDPRFSSSINSAPVMPDGRPRPGWFFAYDAGDHEPYRQLLTRHFTVPAVRRLAPRVRAVVRHRLDGLLAGGPGADLWEEFAWPVPGLVICDLLGVPAADQAGFEAQAAVFDHTDGVAEDVLLSTWEGMWTAMRDLASRKQREPDDDLMSWLLAPRGGAGVPLGLDEAASVALSLRLAGQAPVAHVLALGTMFLLQDPARVASVTAGGDATVRSVDELLRYLPTNNLGVVRVATEDAVIRHAHVSAGDLVLVSLPAASRDPERFDDPETADLARPTSRHLAFGHGTHRCLGANLARLELQIAFHELFSMLPNLRLAVPVDQVEAFESTSSYGLVQLPVTW